VHPLNWAIVVVYIIYVTYDGLKRSRDTTGIEGYFLANRSLPWWAVGLSVMATQLSAVTMIGGTGQGATDGMRFVQFYFGLPLAMVILSFTIVPFLHGARVFTAYEFLERRFGPATRALTALLFLISRGMSCGAIIAAPAVVFSAIFGWNVWWSVMLIGLPTVIYTMIGGVQAITWVDVKQMVLIVAALVAIVIVLLVQLPVSPNTALHIAGSAGRLRVFDLSFDLSDPYTLWSGMIGGTFLMLSYFGTDQSQVQRYLTAKSVDEARSSLLMSAYWKIPLQALVLLVGVLVFVFYQFTTPPILFNPAHDRAVRREAPTELAALERSYATEIAARNDAARLVAARSPEATAVYREHNRLADSVRGDALTLAGKVTNEKKSDVNYIMPRFVLDHLPIGLAGLFIAAVLAAAMSSIAAELNSLATATVIDFYRRWVRPEGTDEHFLKVSKGATLFWGIFACLIATYAVGLGSLIEVVNRFGSFFYGSILGVFILAMIPRASGPGALIGMVAGMATVGWVAFNTTVAFLWQNVIGAVTVVTIGMLVSLIVRGKTPASVSRATSP
jgi:SSS family solute:Na+ symporter